MRIITVVGARPQFVKASMLSRALRPISQIEQQILHTGQHYDRNMSEVFFAELEIPAPAFDLGIGSGPHGRQTGQMLEEIEKILLSEKPDGVVVFGDTNSTLAGALAAAKLNIPVAHVEAGLRSFNRRMAEEINRVLTDHVSLLLFAPTVAAMENLEREGIHHSGTLLVGDIMYDAALYYGELATRKSNVLDKLKVVPNGYILSTVHRAENTDSPAHLNNILTGLGELSRHLPVIFPLHPRTRAAMLQIEGCDSIFDQIKFTEPLGYLDMLMLEKNARVIVTDSGGIQKEAFFFRVPCITLRAETEWNELIDVGWNRLAIPDDPNSLKTAFQMALGNVPSDHGQPYGDGHAAELMAHHLLELASFKPGPLTSFPAFPGAAKAITYQLQPCTVRGKSQVS